MQIIFHGAAGEVGRSCIELLTDKSRIFLDSGIKVTQNGIEYPLKADDLPGVDAIFLSHAHLDHSGALPFFAKQGFDSPVYCTDMTKHIAKILLLDSHKVERLENFEPKYSHEDINKAFRLMKGIQIEKQYDFKDILFSYLPAGHISGASSILLETGKKKILYTADFNTVDIHTVMPARNVVKNVDYLIIDTTYGNRDHPDRKDTEIEFIAKVKEVLKRGGNVVISGFAVGRIQEIIMMLANANINVPIYVDGMGNKINKLLLAYAKNTNDIKDYKAFKKSLDKIRVVKGHKERSNISDKQAIYVATSGMLTGGPVMGYVKNIWDKPESALLLTGYQVEGTNGRLLLDTGNIFLEGVEVKVKCEYHKYDFSAHAGLKEMKEYVKRVNPKHVILQHGDPEALAAFKVWLSSNSYDSTLAKIGEVIELD